MAYLFSQWTPNIQKKRLFVLKTGWNFDSLQMMKFVNVWSTWSMVHPKTRFEAWITLNDVNGVSLFHISYLITFMVYLRSQQTPNVQIKYFICVWSIFTLFVPNRAWKCESLQIKIFVYVCSTWVIFKLKPRFEKWITGNDVNDVRLIHSSYLITIMPYMCSQWAPNIQHNYFMFGWSIFTLFVLNRAWKRDSHQIMIFVYICSRLNIVELKTRYETWITLNDVKGVSLFHLSYSITLMVYLRSQQTPNVQIKYFMFDWPIFTLYALNRCW
jgi:succinate-acetate transporter protein